MLPPDHQISGANSAQQSAPEHEPRPTQHRAEIVHQDRVVKLATEESADDRGEDDVADWLGIVSAPRELTLRDDLRNDEREQHRQPESSELKGADIPGSGLVNYRGENLLHCLNLG